MKKITHKTKVSITYSDLFSPCLKYLKENYKLLHEKTKINLCYEKM